MNYEAVIGLEVHIQIKTKSKMFTRVATGYGQEPNTLTDPVVLALPGVHLHLYGKAEPRPGRKMGHLTVTAGDGAQALATAREAAARLGLPLP